jgi:hypothetical protein
VVDFGDPGGRVEALDVMSAVLLPGSRPRSRSGLRARSLSPLRLSPLRLFGRRGEGRRDPSWAAAW